MLPIVITEFSQTKVAMMIVNLNNAVATKNADGSWNAIVYRDGIGIPATTPDRARAVDFMCGQLIA